MNRHDSKAPRLLVLALGLCLCVAAAGNSSRLTVVNETLDPVAGGASTIDVYLSRLGTYYAELYLERDGEPAPAAVPADIDLSIAFRRGREVVFERSVRAHFEAGAPVSTMLFLEVPRDLPQRKPLAMQVRLGTIDPALGAATDRLRLQLTRKLQLLRPGR